MLTRLCRLSLFAAAVSLLGCAAGEEQNYKVLERERPLLDTRDPGDRPGASVAVDRHWAMLDLNATMEPEANAEPDADAAATSPEDVAQAANDDVPPTPQTATSLDRSTWTRVVIEPYDGRVSHQPTYHRDLRFRDDQSPLRSDDLQERFTAALAGGKSAFWDCPNAAEAVLNPIKFGIDTVVAPVRMIFNPPWSTDYSPQ